MPKIKTNRAAAKRIKLTKNGKCKRWHSNTGHLKTQKKDAKRRRRLTSSTIASKADNKKIKRLVPYL